MRLPLPATVKLYTCGKWSLSFLSKNAEAYLEPCQRNNIQCFVGKCSLLEVWQGSEYAPVMPYQTLKIKKCFSLQFFQGITQLTFTCSKSTIETLENAWNMFKVNNQIIDVSVLLCAILVVATVAVFFMYLWWFFRRIHLLFGCDQKCLITRHIFLLYKLQVNPEKKKYRYPALSKPITIRSIFNILEVSVFIIHKPVNWFVPQIDWLSFLCDKKIGFKSLSNPPRL